MEYLPENVRKAFEQYINGNKKEAFDLLIPGSRHHLYLSILDTLKSDKGAITESTKEMIDKFKKIYPGFESNRLDLQALLLEFDQATTDQERDKIISMIDKNYVYGYYDYSKPAEIKTVMKRRGSSSGGKLKGITSKSAFDQSKFYNEENTLSKMYKSTLELNDVNISLLNKVDYMRINERSFERFMDCCSCLYRITTKSFMKKLISFVKDKYKKQKHFAI